MALRIDRLEMLNLHQLEAYLNSPSVAATALKEDYTLPTAPANHVMLTEEERAAFDEIGYASLTGALRSPRYDKIKIFNTKAEALACYTFMILSERVCTRTCSVPTWSGTPSRRTISCATGRSSFGTGSVRLTTWTPTRVYNLPARETEVLAVGTDVLDLTRRKVVNPCRRPSSKSD